MNLSVILVLLPMFLNVVYSDEDTLEIFSVLELFPEFKQMNDRVNKLETSVKQTNDRIKILEEGIPYKTRLRNYRVKSEVTASTVFSSGLECWIKCTETNGCSSASFLSEGGKCELSRVTHVSYEVLEKAVGWVVFTKHTPVGWTLPYKTHLRNYKVQTEQMKSTVFSSGLECWVKCAETNGCTSASFQSQGGKCELSRVTYMSYEVLEKAVGWDVFAKHTPVVSLHDHNYSLNLAAAKAHCVSLGLSIATLDDLTTAYNSGYQKCNCGWAANGLAYVVMQVADKKCLSSVGVLNCNWRSTWNVYCRPLKTD